MDSRMTDDQNGDFKITGVPQNLPFRLPSSANRTLTNASTQISPFGAQLSAAFATNNALQAQNPSNSTHTHIYGQLQIEAYSGLEGFKTQKDYADLARTGVFERRTLDSVEIRVQFGVITYSGNRYADSTVAILPAEEFQTPTQLLNAVQSYWPRVFKETNLTVPPEGIQASQIQVEARESYGGNTWSFSPMNDKPRYTKWFNKNAWHGRADMLYMRVVYEFV